MRFLAGLGLLGLIGCASTLTAAPAVVAHRAPSVAQSTSSAAPAPASLAWESFSAETFARAKAERKFVVMDGSAEWCHWCHVMEATTYHDDTVRALLAKSFIAVKVDIDTRPDLAERYGDYGWPATVIFSPDADELGKYRGYIPPEKFIQLLKEVAASGAATTAAGADPGKTAGYVIGESRKAPRTPLAEEHLAWLQHSVDVELDDYWDPEQGGWGRGQKAAVGSDNAWMLWKAESGDATAKKKVLFTLDQQDKLLDPVWGGIYQYSAAAHWDEPHFEKLMTFQAPAIENYAVAYRLTKDVKHLVRARSLVGYVDRFLKGPEGGFYTTQDADLGMQIDGHAYYALPEKERLARGIPRIDTHEYGKENGLAIAAYVTMYDVTKDANVLASAEKAARRVLATHASPDTRGGITHDRIDPSGKPKVLFLSDNASFGFALARLAEATKNPEYAKAARAIGDFMLTELVDDEGGGLFGSTKDPDAVGIFAKRRIPFEDNVVALRFFARLARTSIDAKYEAAIDRILRAISTPEEIKARGRWLGDYLLALEETKGVRGAAK